jgi:hypothetical protein
MNDIPIPQKIEKELQELAKYSRVSIHEHFWEISQSHQLEHEQLLKEAMLEYDELNDWQSDNYYKLRNKAQKSGYVAIIFATTYIEAVIYNFGAIYLGDKYVKTHLDKLSSISKLCVLIKIITGKDINTDGQAYEHLNILFKYRNSLVHSKSSPLKSNEEMMIFKEKCTKNYYQAIESAKYAVEYLKKETQQLNQDEFHPGIFG